MAQTGDVDLQQKDCNGKGEFLVNSGVDNCGIKGRTDKTAKIFPANTITVDFWGNAFYRNFEYKMATHNHVFSLSGDVIKNENIGLFLTAQFSYMRKLFSFEYMGTWNKIKPLSISLPITSTGEIDFNFMESFIRELEEERIRELNAYLEVTGLKDYTLTPEEEIALEAFSSLTWEEVAYNYIFNNIKQGRRLKKDDQIQGEIPFVMAGTTNTGLVNYISNPIAKFPANSITIDIFGNTFYRNYSFGAGDDTGVYWNNKIKYSTKVMLFFACAMEKSVRGKFSYGNKLRSSQSLDFKMQLPTKNNLPDYSIMETFISAIQKLVIQDVVLYAENKIAATKGVIKENVP